MNPDTELDLWRQEWQAETAVPADLRARVARQTRNMKLLRLADILVTIVMGGITTAWAVSARQADMVVLAMATWIFLAAAWTGSLIINRGKWAPSALDTAAFLDLSIRRCRSRLSTIRLGAALFVCEIAFCLAWIYRHKPSPRQPVVAWLLFGSLAMDYVWVFTLAFFGFLLWYRRKKRAELAYLLDVSGQDHGF